MESENKSWCCLVSLNRAHTFLKMNASKHLQERGAIMKINQQVHLIRKEFYVTPQIKRYINIYLIEGQYCYLIDSGVAGSEKLIEEYLQSINRRITDIKGIFLTHSHPDHAGGAAAIKRKTNCSIYAPREEVSWIENVQIQFTKRPIPNFHQLLSESVKVDVPLDDGAVIQLEGDLRIEAISTKGHSHGSMSFCLNQQVLFTGDAIPVEHDLPIFADYGKTIESLQRIQGLSGIQYCCPAWDEVYSKEALSVVIEKSKSMLRNMKDAVLEVEKAFPQISKEDKVMKILERAGLIPFVGNPLVVKSIEACMESKI